MKATPLFQVAETIREQIGHGALAMLGAKNFAADNKSLTFKICGSPKHITHVKIRLTVLDTYTIDFIRCASRKAPEILAVVLDVYANELRGVIEEHTKLYTHL